ncbi:rod shape-determining protein MreC [Thiohalomonas denitrificans]|uniref:rod shape-determining protein MreC n=1 Tax=Thiohalomonas denitrificans TaxID=415747 RepID=UPI0026F064C1|nr:rod shape-determining protein MreC [Thiohalomonas denitrificans]
MFQRGPSMAMRAALLVLASVFLMTLDHRQQHLETMRATLAMVLYPLEYLVSLPATAGNWASDAFAARSHLISENENLRSRQLKLEARLLKFDALLAENSRLREMLQSPRMVDERLLVAELLAVDMDPFKRQAVLNKGSLAGVYRGHPVLDAKGVMGQVTEVSPVSSVAMLITDPSHAIPVQFNRSGLRAIALGTGEADRLELPHIPNTADIRVGDLLVTSGLDRRFPPGYPVAKIQHVDKDPSQPYAFIVARPTAELERVREVLLIWPDHLTETSESEAALGEDAPEEMAQEAPSS